MNPHMTDDLPLILSPEQTAITRQSGKVISVGYEDDKTAAETIVVSVLQAFCRGENSIIVCRDSKLHDWMIQKLRLYLMPGWYRSVNIPEFMEDSDAEHFRTMTSASGEAGTTMLKMKRFVLEANYQKTMQRHSFLQKPVWNHFTVKDLYYNYASKKSESGVASLLYHISSDKTAYSPEHYKYLMDEVTLAQKLFPDDDFFTHESKEIKIPVESALTVYTPDEWLFWLQEQIDSIRNIKKQYFNFIQRHKKQFHQAHTAELRNTEDKIMLLRFLAELPEEEYLNDTVSKIKISSLFTNDSDKLTEKEAQCRKIAEEIIRKLGKCAGESTLPAYTDIAHLPDFIENCSKIIAACYESLDLKADNVIRSLNNKNTPDRQLFHLENQLKKCIEAINQSNLLTRTFELNTLSGQKQAQICENIEAALLTALKELQRHKVYADWMMFYNHSTPMFKNIFSCLKDQPVRRWERIVMDWYMNAFVENKMHYYDAGAAKSESLPLQSKEIVNSALRLEEANRYRLIRKKMKTWETKHRDLWHDIFRKKKLRNYSWKYGLEKCTEFIAAFYPVLVLSDDDLEGMETGGYQNIFYLNHKNPNPEILQYFKTIHSYFAVKDYPDLQTDYRLQLHYLEDMAPIRETALSERLQTARSLSRLLTSVSPKLKFYQTKKLNIISCLSDIATYKMEEVLSGLGLKELKMENNPEDHVIECILETERFQVLLIENGQPSAEYQDMLWQYHIVEKMKQSGFEIISFDFDEAVEYEENYFEHKLKKILSRFSTKSQARHEATTSFV